LHLILKCIVVACSLIVLANSDITLSRWLRVYTQCLLRFSAQFPFKYVQIHDIQLWNYACGNFIITFFIKICNFSRDISQNPRHPSFLDSEPRRAQEFAQIIYNETKAKASEENRKKYAWNIINVLLLEILFIS